jgi:aldehyde dehydrogenase (NAD+)
MNRYEAKTVDAVIRGLFVDNCWRTPESSRTVEIRDPALGSVLQRVAACNAQDVDLAVQSARKSLQGDWGLMDAAARASCLSTLAAQITAEAEDIARCEATHTGKPIEQARQETESAAQVFALCSKAVLRGADQRALNFSGRYHCDITRFPHGVTGHIIPWTAPLLLAARTLAPALAMGNACVIKPSENACLTVLRMAELAREAGFPPGALNVVTGRGELAGAALSAHPCLDFLAFTGSPEVGTLVQVAVARNHIGCAIERGGKSPHIIFEDGDHNVALDTVIPAITLNSGQSCHAGARVLVHASLACDFIARLRPRFAALVAGLPDSEADLGPVINAMQKRRVERFCRQAIADGIPVIASGRVADDAPAEGHFVKPMAFGPVPPDHPLAREDVFGPVLSVLIFDDEVEAIRLAQSVSCGPLVRLWTGDRERALRIRRALPAAELLWNSRAYGLDDAVQPRLWKDGELDLFKAETSLDLFSMPRLLRWRDHGEHMLGDAKRTSEV